MRFEELDLQDEVLDALWDMNFSECTPIQEKAIPVALEGHDILGVAQTGTGKTAAYLLPVINRLSREEFAGDAVNCIVMVPTRELAQQIDRQLQGFAYFLPISNVAVYGGTDGIQFSVQERGLKMGADIVVATPGRLLSLINMGGVNLDKVSFFILDEADRMLDMGFQEDIMQIERLLPKERQTLLFSATMPEKILKLASKILRNPVEIKLAVSKPAEKVQQEAYVCYEPQKTPLLLHLLRNREAKRVIVFASTKLKVRDIARELRKAKLNVREIHSDLDQIERENSLLDFRAGKTDVIVATDILSRGIDIDDIRMVVNFDVPREEEDYVHRVGRTARADNDGLAVTFVGDKEQSRFASIEKFIDSEVTKSTVPKELGETPPYAPKTKKSGGRKHKYHRTSKNNSKRKPNNYKSNAKANSNHRDRRSADGGSGNQ